MNGALEEGRWFSQPMLGRVRLLTAETRRLSSSAPPPTSPEADDGALLTPNERQR